MKKSAVIILFLIVGSLLYAHPVDKCAARAMEKALGEPEPGTYSGVDELIVERYAEAAGRKAWEPFINTDRGDLLLFVFLIAGISGGFMLGYFYRALMVEKADITKSRTAGPVYESRN